MVRALVMHKREKRRGGAQAKRLKPKDQKRSRVQEKGGGGRVGDGRSTDARERNREKRGGHSERWSRAETGKQSKEWREESGWKR